MEDDTLREAVLSFWKFSQNLARRGYGRLQYIDAIKDDQWCRTDIGTEHAAELQQRGLRGEDLFEYSCMLSDLLVGYEYSREEYRRAMNRAWLVVYALDKGMTKERQQGLPQAKLTGDGGEVVFRGRCYSVSTAQAIAFKTMTEWHPEPRGISTVTGQPAHRVIKGLPKDLLAIVEKVANKGYRYTSDVGQD